MIALILAALVIQLSWMDNSSDEDGFKIQAAPTCDQSGAGNFADIGQVGANVTTFNYPSAQEGQCFRVYAFNAAGPSGFSNVVQIPVNQNVVTIKTSATVTLSRRATDTSTVIAILVNANTVIGPGGFEITYPAGYTLTVSRRASNTSSVMAVLVNKSNVVIINGTQQP